MPLCRFVRWGMFGLLLATTIPALAETSPQPALAEPRPDHPLISGFERFHATGDTAIEGGRLLLGELNCTSCHAAEDAVAKSLQRKQAPILSDVGARVKPDWLRRFLADPQQTKPGTTMPHLFAGVSPKEREEQIDALVHFLASTGTVTDSFPDSAAAKRGEKLYQRVGCVACHQPAVKGIVPLATSVPLGDLSAKYSVTSLAAFVREPLKVRPSGRMPKFSLKEEDSRDLAHFFIRGVQVRPNLKYSVYFDDWSELPDFETMRPDATGEAAGFDIGVSGRASNYGIRFEGYLRLPREGRYNFHLGSDDGSRLIIDGETLVTVDGLHPFEVRSERHYYQTGVYPVIVEYFQAGGDQQLRVEFDGPGIPRQSLASIISLTKDNAPEPQTGFRLDESLAAKGRELFTTLGCASCHELKRDGKRLASKSPAKPLMELNLAAGCLSNPTSGRIPNFHLNDTQQTALAAALKSPETWTAQQDQKAAIQRTLTAFNCYACHSRDGVGGPEQPRDLFFETTMKEMGDEGRLPPPLNGVGDKLRPEWMRRIFNQGADDRPYMLARMPEFGLSNVGHLVEAFAAVDAKNEVPEPKFNEPLYRVKSDGRFLVGGQALSCIKCHDFAQYESTGIRAMNLTRMTQRLRHDWFHRYLMNPQDYRPGTRMPAAWPFGQATVRNILNANADQQIEAIWVYLSDGEKAAVPSGLIREPIELVPKDAPLVYRNFIEGAGPRAIAVGYPEKVNLAFDADDMRLALVWHGAFIDASKHWAGRGQGFEPPLGDDVLTLPTGVPFATLDSVNTSWPPQDGHELGYHFRGYRLAEQKRPELHYSLNGLNITDLPVPYREGDSPFPGLERTLIIETEKPVEHFYYRAAVADKIEPLGDGWYRINAAWKLRLEGPGEPIVRPSHGKTELLMPVVFQGNTARIKQWYVW